VLTESRTRPFDAGEGFRVATADDGGPPSPLLAATRSRWAFYEWDDEQVFRSSLHLFARPVRSLACFAFRFRRWSSRSANLASLFQLPAAF